jgi:hypothetical protein
MENNIIVDNTDNSITITDNDGDYRVVKFKLDIDTNTVKVKELCDMHFRNNLNYNDMTLLILELTKLRDQLVPELKEDDSNLYGVISKPAKLERGFYEILKASNISCTRVVMNATQHTQQVLLPISEERKKMAVKQQDNIDALLGLKDKK